eukprot:1086729-Prorocentrum_minimum.AAC.1
MRVHAKSLLDDQEVTDSLSSTRRSNARVLGGALLGAPPRFSSLHFASLHGVRVLLMLIILSRSPRAIDADHTFIEFVRYRSFPHGLGHLVHEVVRHLEADDPLVGGVGGLRADHPPNPAPLGLLLGVGARDGLLHQLPHGQHCARNEVHVLEAGPVVTPEPFLLGAYLVSLPVRALLLEVLVPETPQLRRLRRRHLAVGVDTGTRHAVRKETGGEPNK